MCEWGNTKVLKIKGVDRDVDSCIYDFVKLLNDNGYQTIASCCGHSKQPTSIMFITDEELPKTINKEDVKEIRIMTYDQARLVDKLFPPIND